MASLFIFPPVSLSFSEYSSYTYYSQDILLGTVAIEFSLTHSLPSRNNFFVLFPKLSYNCIRQRRAGILGYTAGGRINKNFSAPDSL